MMRIGYNTYTPGAHGTPLEIIKKSTYIMTHSAKLADLHEDTKYIILIRDPRDVMLSWCRIDIPRSGGDLSSIEVASDFWTEETLIAKLGNWLFFPTLLQQPNCLAIQYERMCLNPITELIRVGKFLGISPTADLDAVVKRTDLADFESGIDRYNMQFLKCQHDPFFPKDWNGIILDHVGDEMAQWGYFPDRHGDAILAAL